jgi:hypothetical protein
MDKACPEFERRRNKLGTWLTEGERRAWEAHLARCPACCDQMAAEEALEDLFSKAAPPELSSRFNENLRQRIAAESRVRNRWPFLVMQGYWLAASLISAVILLNMASLNARGGLLVGMCLLLFFAGPILLLGRRLRFGLFDLILSTMDSPEKSAQSYRNGILS